MTDAAHEAYNRLVAAQRVISPEERFEIEREDERERLRYRIKRRLPKVY
jgi:hypothetical protein